MDKTRAEICTKSHRAEYCKVEIENGVTKVMVRIKVRIGGDVRLKVQKSLDFFYGIF